MQRTLLALALIATSGVSYAQTMSTAVDANGRPVVGRNDWVRQPGDGPGPGAGSANMASAPNVAYGNAQMSGTSQMGTPLEKGGKLSTQHATGPEPMPPDRGPHQVAFRDEYGFRYDADGNRLDGRGYVMSPHIPSR
ncbi:MAG: hypothetical protein JOY64_14655 [Alphaproteobacteria bacterium]|nr:hypothetical protein [Alphaproteobacteria bacterium]MBV8408870.1 hypothetical protein [Alphaproteobacteria bacterium]